MVKTKQNGDRYYDRVLHLLQTFIKLIRQKDLENDAATEIYGCVATLRETIRIQNIDGEICVQLESAMESILEILLGKTEVYLRKENTAGYHQVMLFFVKEFNDEGNTGTRFQ